MIEKSDNIKVEWYIEVMKVNFSKTDRLNITNEKRKMQNERWKIVGCEINAFNYNVMMT